ncbi:MAG: ribosomal RNA small subunit methyltransferase A [Bacteroidetes bacterium]|nr:ribosomal RNA small subunit methyltransferase A [Bacteroidota bacterium]
MKNIKLKKQLGQHFLTNTQICERIFNSIKININEQNKLLEIGPGDGALTKYLYNNYSDSLYLIEIDSDLIKTLNKNFPKIKENIINADFLKFDIKEKFKNDKINIVGNFPYNISSQIFYKIIENRNLVENVICMVQKEVGERIVSGPGSKKYGIPSVLIQAYYDVEYLFEVLPESFNPPPKVKSCVIKLKRNTTQEIKCDFNKFKDLVKTAFNQRRKTLKNALKSLDIDLTKVNKGLLSKRAEELNVEEFISIVLDIS